MAIALCHTEPPLPRASGAAQALSAERGSSDGESTRAASIANVEIDPRTLHLAIEGERDAVEALIRFYERRVFAFVSRCTGPGTHVEDLAQEVFLRVFRALPRFESGRAKVSTWIFTIAVRLIQDQRKRKRPSFVTPDENLSDGAHSPEEICDGRLALTRLEELVQRLPDEQRMALVLVQFHGQSVSQVSQAMGCAEATVKTRVHRARTFLKDTMRREEEL